MKKTDVVLVGKIVGVTKNLDYNYPEYDIAIEYYLKNPKSQNLLHVANSVAQPFSDFNRFYENYPVLKKGDRLFAYIDDNEGRYSLLPYTFPIPDLTSGPHDPVKLVPLKEKYHGDKTIEISGGIDKGYLYKRSENGKASDVRIRILDPNSAVYKEDVIEVSGAGSFYYDFDIFEKYPRSGTYEAFILVGDAATGISFEYVSNAQKISEKNWVNCKDDFRLVTKASDNSLYCVKKSSVFSLMSRGWAKYDELFVKGCWLSFFDYDIQNGEILSAEPHPESSSIVFEIEAQRDGILNVHLQKKNNENVLCPFDQGHDEDIFVLIDGVEIAFEEISEKFQRTLIIKFPTGTQNIEVVKTFVLG
jgi:hypothetical protein